MLHIAPKKFLWQGVCYQQLQIKNHGLVPVETSLALHFAVDYVDIFEVCGRQRQARGENLRPEVAGSRVVLGYWGLDGVVRRTLLQFLPTPSVLTASAARLDLSLRPQQAATFYLTVGCERQPTTERLLIFDDARTKAESDLERYNAWSCHLHTSNGEINAWVSRAVSDLHMMTTELATGPYPYAGLPWFNTPFGRDGIITSLEGLWLRPSLARGVLAYLAST
jgi:glycogen debranching enzyme